MARPRKYNISLTDDEGKQLKSIMHKKTNFKNSSEQMPDYP